MRDTRVAYACKTDNAGRSASILNVCVVHNARQHVTLRIRHNIPLATFDLLAGVEAAWPARFCCLDALTIDDGRRRFFIATAQPARDAKEPFGEEVKVAAVMKPVEIILDSREWW